MTHNKKNDKWGPQNSCIHANEGPTMSQRHSFMFLLFVFGFVIFFLQYERNRCSTEFRSDSNFLFFYISLLSACKLTPHPSFCTTKFIITHYSLSLSWDCFIYNYHYTLDFHYLPHFTLHHHFLINHLYPSLSFLSFPYSSYIHKNHNTFFFFLSLPSN